MEFREILKDLMIEFRLNQTQLANLIGVKPSQVCEWLNGKAKPGFDNIKAIAIALQVSADYILGLEDIGGTKLY